MSVNSNSFSVGKRLIAALDVPSGDKAFELAKVIGSDVEMVKIGLELFCAEGPELVKTFKAKNFRIMLDLKLHDIPVTVGRATKRVAGLGCDFLTIHSGGGLPMMKEAVDSAGEQMKVLAVTVLTSMDAEDLKAVGADSQVADVVVKRALLAKEAGCHGVVASPKEAKIIRKAVGPDMLIVTPGVRPSSGPQGDQKRVTTPKEALELGADMIVVGRPIRDAADPKIAAREICQQLQ